MAKQNSGYETALAQAIERNWDLEKIVVFLAGHQGKNWNFYSEWVNHTSACVLCGAVKKRLSALQIAEPEEDRNFASWIKDLEKTLPAKLPHTREVKDKSKHKV